jgi:hypothetical protein
MRVALVKQALDVFGSWSGVKWKDTSPIKIFEVWPSRALFWELTCMLQADWYIVPQAMESDYTRDAVQDHPGRAEVIGRYTKNIVAPEDIPFEKYDLVITFDPILKVPPGSPTLFAYFALEHWDRIYTASLRRPLVGYDLFLAHMIDCNATVESLPQAVSFPYPHDSMLVRSIFPAEKQELVWVDWRTLTTLAMQGPAEPWSSESEAASVRLGEILELPILQRGKYFQQSYGFADPPVWGDAASYFQALAECKYYVGVGRVAGAGQGLGDAAAAGCLCVGQSEIAYHRLICHAACLCEDIAELPTRLKALRDSTDLQQEVLAYQDEALRKHFEQGPLNLLRQAVQMKSVKRSLASARGGK